MLWHLDASCAIPHHTVLPRTTARAGDGRDTAPASPVVLLVDEDADALAMYKAGLACYGFLPLTTSEIDTVVTQVAAVKPDVVVTHVPVHAGSVWTVIEDLRHAPHSHRIPVVILTGAREPASIKYRADELGCAAVLLKPCTPDVLADALRQVLHP